MVARRLALSQTTLKPVRRCSDKAVSSQLLTCSIYSDRVARPVFTRSLWPRAARAALLALFAAALVLGHRFAILLVTFHAT